MYYKEDYNKTENVYNNVRKCSYFVCNINYVATLLVYSLLVTHRIGCFRPPVSAILI